MYRTKCNDICFVVTQSSLICTKSRQDNQKTPFVNGLVFFHVFCLGEPRSGNVKSKSKHIYRCLICLEGTMLIAEQTLRNVTWQIISWPRAHRLPKQTKERLHYDPNSVCVTYWAIKLRVISPSNETKSTVKSRYSGHPRDRDLVSEKERVRNSGVWENVYFTTIFTGESHVCSFSLSPVPFSDPLSYVKSVRTLFTNRTELNRTGVVLLST